MDTLSMEMNIFQSDSRKLALNNHSETNMAFI